MRKLIDRARKKLRGVRGASLTEMLCVLIVLSLVSGVMVSAVNLAAKQYQESLRKSEAQVLASTLEAIISSELALTQYIKSGDPLVFQSQHSIKVVLTTDGSGQDGYGQLMFQSDEGEKQNLLGKGAYTRGLLARVDSLTYNNSTYTFTVKLSIACGDIVYVTRTFDVINVNKKTAT